jgi:hypothetical protein
MVMDDCGNVFSIEKSNLGEYLEQIKKYKTPNHMCFKSSGNALTQSYLCLQYPLTKVMNILLNMEKKIQHRENEQKTMQKVTK